MTKPVWNTEVNYGLSAGGVGARPRAIGIDRQAAYVVRTYLLNAANGSSARSGTRGTSRPSPTPTSPRAAW